MTRDEAITAIHKAHHPEDHGHSTGKSISNRHWAEKAVDGYVALGMLKLDEPKSVLQMSVDALNAAVSKPNVSTVSILNCLQAAGLKIVEITNDEFWSGCPAFADTERK